MSSTTDSLVVHRRQFVIGEEGLDVPVNWDRRELGAGIVLHYHPETAVVADGHQTTIGIELPGGVGRFVRVSDGRVSADPAGTLGLYVMAGSGGLTVTSSAALAAAIGSLPRAPRELDWYSFNWHMAPGSGFSGLRRVLPGQAVDLSSGEISVGPPIRPSALNVDDRSVLVAERLIESVSSLADVGVLRVALTAGLDSRTVMAACIAADVEFSTYTIEPPRAGDRVDLTVAKQLSELASVEHRTVSLQSVDRSIARGLDEHTGGESRDADRYLATRGAYEGFEPEEIMVRGGVFEIGRRFFADTLGHLDRRSVQAAPTRILERVQLGPLAKRASQPSIEEWTQRRLGGEHEPIVSWIDQFYLDQRVGAWLASNEQLLDSLPGRSVHPASDPEVLSCLVVPEGQPPIGRDVQRLVIERCAPGIAAVPFNPHEAVSRRDALRGRFSAAARLVRTEARSASRYGTGLQASKSS